MDLRGLYRKALEWLGLARPAEPPVVLLSTNSPEKIDSAILDHLSERHGNAGTGKTARLVAIPTPGTMAHPEPRDYHLPEVVLLDTTQHEMREGIVRGALAREFERLNPGAIVNNVVINDIRLRVPPEEELFGPTVDRMRDALYGLRRQRRVAKSPQRIYSKAERALKKAVEGRRANCRRMQRRKRGRLHRLRKVSPFLTHAQMELIHARRPGYVKKFLAT